MVHARLAQLVFAVIGLAVMGGCVGEDEPSGGGPDATPSVAPPAEFTEDTGAVSGSVTDEEFLPVAGAAVALLELELETTTAGDGTFSFSRVQPGTYSLVAAKLGHESIQKKVDVVAGQVTEGVAIVLPVLPVVEPRQFTEHFSGLIVCSVGYEFVLSEECGEGLGTPAGTVGGDPNNNIDWKFNLTDVENLESIYLELDWDPASAAAGQLAFNVAHGFTCEPSCEADITYPECGAFDNYGPPVVDCVLDGDDLGIDDPETELPWDITARAWAAPSPAEDPPNIVLEQTFDMYATYFYGEPMPEDFSAVPDQ